MVLLGQDLDLRRPVADITEGQLALFPFRHQPAAQRADPGFGIQGVPFQGPEGLHHISDPVRDGEPVNEGIDSIPAELFEFLATLCPKRMGFIHDVNPS